MSHIFCWSIFLFLLTAANSLIMISQFRSGNIMCDIENTVLLFESCDDSQWFYPVLNFLTLMSTATMLNTF